MRKNPEKSSPRKLVPTGDRTRARCVTGAHATTWATAVDFLTVWMDTLSPPQYRTQTCHLPFTHNPTRSLSKNAGLLVSYINCQTPPRPHLPPFETHTNSSSNHVTSPDSTSVNPPIPSSPQQHLQSLISILYSDNFWEKNLCHSQDSNHRSPVPAMTQKKISVKNYHLRICPSDIKIFNINVKYSPKTRWLVHIQVNPN